MNLARWRTVVGADSRFHATRPLFWILLLLLALLAFGLAGGNVRMQSGDTAIGGDKQVWLTSEFSNALAFGMMGVIPYVFFIGIAAGMAILRDEELNVGPILHSTRLRPSEYVRGKFAAVLLACFTVLLGHVLLAVFFNHVMPTANAENIRGPLSWTNYLRPAFVMIGPLIVFMAGTTFALGTITRNAVLVFVLPLIVFIVCPFLLWEEHLPAWVSPGLEMALRWIDPSGFRWINETWVKVDLGVDYYNLQPVTYDVPFLLSRLAFVAVGLLAAFAAEVHFARTLRGEKAPRERRGFLRGRRVRSAPAATGLAPSAFEGKSLASLSMQSRRPGFLRTVRDVLSVEARALATSPGLYIFAPLIILEIVSNDLFETGPFEVPMLSTPGTAAVSALGLLTTILCFLLLFYTTESVLRDFHRNLAPISHATPARTGAILLGKALANGIVAAVILAAAAIGNVIIMLVQGKIAPDLGPVLLVWGGLAVPTVILWATFVTFVVALTGSRFATYGIGLGVMFFTAWKNFRGEMNWVGNWSLWSTARWTDFGGLALNESAFLWNRLFWLSIAALLVALAVKRFPRREFDDARQHARWTPKQLGKSALRLSPFLVPALVLGAGLYVKTTHGFQGSAAERREKEYWGRNYATWADASTPEIGGVDVSLTLDPAERAFAVDGEYVLVNLSDEPMPRFPMSVGDHFRDISWTLNGEEAKPEHRARLYVFTPDTPLMPGDSLRVGFAHHGAYPDGFTKNGGGMGTFILESGIVLTSFESAFLPLPFFEIGRGIEKDNRMDPRDYPPDYWHGITKPGIGSGARFPVRLTIDSPAEYEVHGVGVRTSDSTENGRRTVVWEADHPVNFFNVVGSKRWDCRRGDGVEIWHLPEHTYNLDEMVTALEGARRWYSEWFFPYPWRDLRVNEFPGLASYAQGFPTNITFSEAIGFLTRDTDEVDAAFLVTAHEAAHQWWGNIILPGEGPGGNVISEGAAHYSTILLHRQVKGEKARRSFCERIEKRYGDARQVDSERPLPRVDGSKGGDNTTMYDRGGWVMFMLHELMGEEAAIAGNHDFMQRFHASRDFPVIDDWVAVMREHAPDPAAFDDFVSQWVYDTVVPEFRWREPVRERDGEGWVVRAKLENLGTGHVTVDVAVTAGEEFPDEGDSSDSESAAPTWRCERRRVTIGPGETIDVELRSAFEPERLVADPDVMVLQLKRDHATADLGKTSGQAETLATSTSAT